MSRFGGNSFLYFKECLVKPYKIHYHRSIYLILKKGLVYYSLRISSGVLDLPGLAQDKCLNNCIICCSCLISVKETVLF